MTLWNTRDIQGNIITTDDAVSAALIVMFLLGLVLGIILTRLMT